MGCSSLKLDWNCLALIPEAPSRDADGHDDVGGHLREENKEEDEEIEGAVTPSREKRGTSVIHPFRFAFHFDPIWNKPEGFVHRPVPTDKGARGEEEGPEDGEAQADPAGRGLHAEHGEGGDQVQEQRASVDWNRKDCGRVKEPGWRRQRNSFSVSDPGSKVSVFAQTLEPGLRADWLGSLLSVSGSRSFLSFKMIKRFRDVKDEASYARQLKKSNAFSVAEETTAGITSDSHIQK